MYVFICMLAYYALVHIMHQRRTLVSVYVCVSLLH